MSDRRVPRYEDDYSAELPIWPPRDETAVPTSSPVRFEKAGEAPPPASPAFALSEQSRLLALLVAERGGIAVGEVVERAVVHYAEHIIGIAALARPMILPRAAGGPKDGRDTRIAPEGDHAQHGGGGFRVPVASGSDPAFSPDDRATGTIDGSVSKPPSSGFAVHSPRMRGEIRSADAQAPP